MVSALSIYSILVYTTFYIRYSLVYVNKMFAVINIKIKIFVLIIKMLRNCVYDFRKTKCRHNMGCVHFTMYI